MPFFFDYRLYTRIYYYSLIAPAMMSIIAVAATMLLQPHNPASIEYMAYIGDPASIRSFTVFAHDRWNLP